jgi:hypothetical protein
MFEPPCEGPLKRICDTSQKKRAEVALSACAAFAGRDTGYASARPACSMMSPARPSKSWRSLPSREPKHG